MRKFSGVLLSLLVISSLPTAAADMQRFLVPLVANEVPGAFGSLWQTELAVWNAATISAPVAYSKTCVAECLLIYLINPNSAERLLDIAAARSGAQGVFIYVPTDASLSLGLRVRDLSRQADSWGTAIPIVRDTDAFSSAFGLIDIPVSQQFRHMLRIYDIAGGAGVVHVQYYTIPLGTKVAEFDVQLFADPARLPFSDPMIVAPAFPAYAQVFEPLSHDTVLDGERVRVRISPTRDDQRLWALVTITNNITQELTIIAPQQ